MQTNPGLMLAESWLVRLVTAAGVAMFGDKVFTNSIALNVAGVITTGVIFAVNEGLHYLKTNKKVVAIASEASGAVTNDPKLALALANLQASLKILETNLASGGSKENVPNP